MPTPADPLPDASPATAPVHEPVERFTARLRQALADGKLRKLVLAKRVGGEADLVRLVARPIVLRGQPHLSLVTSHSTRDLTHNLLPDAAIDHLQSLLGTVFAHAHLLTHECEAELRFSRKGKPAYFESRRGAAQGDAPTSAGTHDRAKHHPLTLDLPFLAALGIATPDGRLVPTMARKWRQINKFVEIVDHALRASPLLADKPELTIADFGCGKGYLTFALHHHLTTTLGLAVQVIGVELRPGLVDDANAIVQRLSLQGLRFEAGDVGEREPAPLDVMIALHACDTATDHAIHFGLRANAALIVCAPCCHKQLRPQMTSLPPPLAPMLSHGVHLGQQAEMLTDAMRALLLQAHGHDTQVFEFVATEHTQKNKMILASRRAQPLPAEPVFAQIRALKDFYAVREHALESLLQGARGAHDAAPVVSTTPTPAAA